MALLDDLSELMYAKPKADEQYYAIQLLGRVGGVVERSCQTHWIGFENDDIRREIREGTLMKRAAAVDYRNTVVELGEYCLLVRSVRDLIIYFLAGGNALIEASLALSRGELRDLVGPRVVVRAGVLGFTGLSSLPGTALNRAPTPKARMAILKRDDYRCRVCGRRPTEHVDVELHVHHIRPWARGGVTIDENLITLCQTCHNGLEPHEDLNLFDLLSPSGNALEDKFDQRRYRDGVVRYREMSVSAWRQLQGGSRPTAQ